MTTEVTTDEYRALAELRYRIRRFLREGDAVAQAAGLEPQQYLLLLTIRGLPAREEATIRTLAERLALKHHSVVELIDRLETHGYVRRTRGREDRRRVLVSHCYFADNACWSKWCGIGSVNCARTGMN